MGKLIKKVHIYVGLLNLTLLVVFAVVGLTATFLPRPNQRARPVGQVRTVEFEIPGNLDDKGVADLLYEHLGLPLANPAQRWNIRRDADNYLQVRFPTASKVHIVTVLEGDSRLRVETVPFDFWQFLSHIHETTPEHANPDLRTTLWAVYVEFSIWSLILMALSGIYLWFDSRPGFFWARLSLATGAGVFLLFYLLVR